MSNKIGKAYLEKSTIGPDLNYIRILAFDHSDIYSYIDGVRFNGRGSLYSLYVEAPKSLQLLMGF